MMLGLKKDKKDEDSGYVVVNGHWEFNRGMTPYLSLEKTAVLQETRTFNETPLSARKCVHVLSKIIYMINQGEQLTPNEAREAFFATTRLFQCKDVTLRRMVHLVIKELPTAPDDAIIATSSLTKDMTGREDGYRATAIRSLCKITDITMLTAIERYLKQALVDRNSAVSSAALVSTLHLGKDNQPAEMVKRWTNEINEALNSDNVIVQYHALGLMYSVKKHDRLAVSKLLAKYTKGGVKSPYATCLLIRIACKVIEDNAQDTNTSLIDFIEACLRHKSEIVIYEAARALCNLPNLTGKDIAPAISVLQLFLSSPKPTLRFAAVKTLNKVASKYPSSVTMCNLDLEHLISDSNRSIATLAITTLLKTGNEGSIERLMKQIQSFMSEIPDEFKIIVVKAIQSLCFKFPNKHDVMINLCSTMLREEGGYQYKEAIVNTIIAVLEANPGSQDTALHHLSEFIEDCEHGVLATKILHLLGREGPKTKSPSKFIRYIYNRIILENATVRAAAITSLAKFGAVCPDLKPSILVLLRRCLHDTHDEVRDRATFYLHVLETCNTALINHYILDNLQASIVGLQSLLVHYIENPTTQPFNLNQVPITTSPAEVTPSSTTDDDVIAEPRKPVVPTKTRQEELAEKLAEIPEFSRLGPLFKSCPKPLELSESETEYYVQCNVHTFQKHVVMQFDVTNTLSDQQLENVTVQVEGENYTVLGHLPCPLLTYNSPGTCYTLLQLPSDPALVPTTFTCTLKFLVKDCDPTTGHADDVGYEDEYVLEDMEVGVNVLFQKVFKTNFAASWDEMSADNQSDETYTLTAAKSLQDAVEQLVKFFGMQPCERTDRVTEGKSSHVLLLAGQFIDGSVCLLTTKMVFDGAVNLKISARSANTELNELMVSSI